MDGRLARSEMSKQAIANALLELNREGHLSPSASMVAERAGVSLRLIFHHFSDMESVFAAASKMQHEYLEDLMVVPDSSLPTEDKIDQFVSARAKVLEEMTNVARAAALQEPFSEELRKSRFTLIQKSREQAAETFGPEIESVADESAREGLLSALDLATSWDTWEYLRFSGKNFDESKGIISVTMRALLGISGQSCS